MIVKLLTELHLKFLSLKGGCRGSSESTHVKMPHCWKSHSLAHIIVLYWQRLFQGVFISRVGKIRINQLRVTLLLTRKIHKLNISYKRSSISSYSSTFKCTDFLGAQ